MYVIILTVGIILVILASVFLPNWIKTISFLSFLASLGYYIKNKEDVVLWVTLGFYCFFMYSWYSTSPSIVNEGTRGWVQIMCIFSLFILFVYFKLNESISNVFIWTVVLVLVAFSLSKIINIVVDMANHWTLLTYLFYTILLCGGLYAAAIRFPIYFNKFKTLIIELMKRLATELNTTPRTVVGVIIVEIIIVLLYFYHSFSKFYFTQNHGHLLLNEPIQLDEINNLNLLPSFAYNYAMSGWFWINPQPSNKGFMTILNYGGIPNITYSSLKNKVRITIKDQSGLTLTLCEIPEIPLQKWNHILINNNRGILDVFFNGKLYKSIEGIIPYKSNEFVNTGEVNGIEGGICNVMYFERPLEISKIKQLYHSFKNYNPPIV